MAVKETNNRPARKKGFRRFEDNLKNYIKEFDNFEDGYNEMISILPTLKVYGGDVANYDMVVRKMMEIIGDNIPSPSNANFPNTLAFTIKQNEVGFRTDDRIAFGWKIYFNRETGKHIYQMRVTFFTVSMSMRKYADALTENGWSVVVFNKEDRFQKQNSANNFKKHNKAANERNEPSAEKSNVPKQQENKKDDTINASDQEILDKVAEPVVNTPAPEPAVVQEQTTEELPPTYTKKQSNQKKFWISKGAVAGVFIITYEGRTFVININDAAQPEGVAIDKESFTIRVGNVIYNYESMDYVIDEGYSQLEEKKPNEDNDEYIIPSNNGKPDISMPTMSQMVSPSGNSSMAQTVVKMTDA